MKLATIQQAAESPGTGDAMTPRMARQVVGEIRDLFDEARREARARNRWLDMKEIRKKVCCSEKWIRDNVLPNLTRHTIKGKVLYREDELDAFLESSAEPRHPLLERMLRS